MKPVNDKITNPKLIIERVPTKIPGFDELIEGGFEKNSTNLLAGSPGVGKSIFAIQFLIGGISRNESCLYVSFEEKKEPFYANMAEFGWDLYEYEKKGLFTFLEYSPNKVKTMLEEGGGDIESIIVKNKVVRIVLDSISAFTLLFENELEKREASLNLINMIKKWNCTSLLTYEVQSVAKEQSVQFRTLDFESDSLIVLYLVRNKNKRERYIEVIKMRGTNHSNNIYKYDIINSGFDLAKKPTENLPDL
jgi:circadian clock protein KaiC